MTNQNPEKETWRARPNLKKKICNSYYTAAKESYDKFKATIEQSSYQLLPNWGELPLKVQSQWIQQILSSVN